MKITIRQANVSDINNIHTFLLHFFSLELEGVSLRPDGIDIEETKMKVPVGKQNDKHCILALDRNNIVGMLTFSRYEKYEYRHCGDFGMVILPEYWRNGIGTSLLTELEKWCLSVDVSKIELGVWSSNLKAIKLYEKFDYVHEGRRIGTVIRGSKTFDLVLMGKMLSKSPEELARISHELFYCKPN